MIKDISIRVAFDILDATDAKIPPKVKAQYRAEIENSALAKRKAEEEITAPNDELPNKKVRFEEDNQDKSDHSQTESSSSSQQPSASTLST